MVASPSATGTEVGCSMVRESPSVSRTRNAGASRNPRDFRCRQKRGPAGISTSTNFRLTEVEVHAVSMACRTTVGFPQIKIVCQQIRGIPFECFLDPAAYLKLGARWVNSEGRTRFSIVCSASRCRRVTRSRGVRAECDAVCDAFPNATPPARQSAIAIPETTPSPNATPKILSQNSNTSR
jgi:hypothetical protein